VPDLRALEGRTCGARRGVEFRRIAQQDLAVRAHVDDQPDFVRGRLVRLFRKDHAYVVRANVAGLKRQHVGLGTQRQLEPQVARLDVHRIADCGAEGRLPELDGRNVQQDVVHHAVGYQNDIGDCIARNLCIGRSFRCQVVQRVHDRVVQRRQASRTVQVAVADAAHQVFAIGHLRVHLAGCRQDLPGSQVAQVHGNRGGPDVDRKAVRLLRIAGLHAHGIAILPNRDGHFPVSLTDDLLQLAQ